MEMCQFALPNFCLFYLTYLHWSSLPNDTSSHYCSLDLMKDASLETQLPCKQTCHIVACHLLGQHFYQSLNVLRCLIQYIPSLALIILLHIFHYVALRKKLIVSIFYIAKLLDHITFVDTPGVLSGEKQRTQRSYDFTGVTSWFAAKCDLILLLFDPHKLDISDEFKRVIGSLKGHDDKIRIVLNKADQVDAQQVSVIAIPL